MVTAENIYYYSYRMGWIISLATDEILGRDGAKVISNLAGFSVFANHYPASDVNQGYSFESISHLQTALEDFYGQNVGHGIALRIGRASFQHILREFGPLFGLTDQTFRLMPLRARLKIGMAALADIFNEYTDQRVHLEDNEKFLLWQIDRCPLCWERYSDRPACQMAVGLIQEALQWISAGKFYNVEESHCRAKGELTCTIVIEKAPMN